MKGYKYSDFIINKILVFLNIKNAKCCILFTTLESKTAEMKLNSSSEGTGQRATGQRATGRTKTTTPGSGRRCPRDTRRSAAAALSTGLTWNTDRWNRTIKQWLYCRSVIKVSSYKELLFKNKILFKNTPHRWRRKGKKNTNQPKSQQILKISPWPKTYWSEPDP